MQTGPHVRVLHAQISEEAFLRVFPSDFRIHDHVRTYEYTALLYSLLNCSAPGWMRPKRCWDLRCAGRRALGDCEVWVASCWLGTRLDMTR